MNWDALGTVCHNAYLAVLTLLCVYGLHRYSLVLTYLRVRADAVGAGGSFSELPRVTVQLPMYNESAVAERVIRAACGLAYPADRLQIQVLDDSTDETRGLVADLVAALRAGGHDITHVERSDRTGYKAGALAAGLEQATGEFIAIFDADFVPPSDFLERTVHHFTDPGVGMVQVRWEHLNRDRNALTQAQAVLLDGHFLIEHTARNRSGRYMSFNGTAGIWRRSAIEDAGGWQHDTLTEDLDLSYRAQLKGWRFVFRPDLSAPAELPPEMSAFKSQQHRWTKGGAQTCLKLLGRVLRTPGDWRVKLEAFFHLTSFVAYILMVVLSILLGPALLHKARTETLPSRFILDGLMFGIATGAPLFFYVISQRELRRNGWRTLRTLPALLALGIGIALNNAVAALDGLLHRAGEFVRTPKFGGGPARARRWRFSWTGIAELGLAAYLSVCLVLVLMQEHWMERSSAAIPFLLLFIVGYGRVGYRSLVGGRTSRA